MKIEWETATEINNDYFTIERSANAIDFEPIAEINGAGNSNTRNTYSYSDNNPMLGINYYRLKQTDYNGYYKLFKIVSINNISNLSTDFIKYYINNSSIKIELMHLSNEITTVQLININGSIINTWHTAPNNKSINIPLKNQTSGVYILTFSNSNIYQSKKIVW